jgi:hypothetical protein
MYAEILIYLPKDDTAAYAANAVVFEYGFEARYLERTGVFEPLTEVVVELVEGVVGDLLARVVLRFYLLNDDGGALAVVDVARGVAVVATLTLVVANAVFGTGWTVVAVEVQRETVLAVALRAGGAAATSGVWGEVEAVLHCFRGLGVCCKGRIKSARNGHYRGCALEEVKETP